nr:hypothetical protein [Rhodoferax sp.]
MNLLTSSLFMLRLRLRLRRHRAAQCMRHAFTIAYQKESQVQRDEQAGDEFKGELANAQRLRGEKLPTLRQRGGEPPLQPV